jgi:hypothetical protein
MLPQQCAIHRIDKAGKEAVTPQQVPKSPLNFIKKRVAPILFYKFFKFRAKFTFIFNILRLYKSHMGTEKSHMGTEKSHMGTNPYN